jgi:hypothetical protein
LYGNSRKKGILEKKRSSTSIPLSIKKEAEKKKEQT